jgi:hypothetical protein
VIRLLGTTHENICRLKAEELIDQGPVKVAPSKMKNPSKSPFTKGDLYCPLWKRGLGGFFGEATFVRSIHSRETDFDVAVVD